MNPKQEQGSPNTPSWHPMRGLSIWPQQITLALVLAGIKPGLRSITPSRIGCPEILDHLAGDFGQRPSWSGQSDSSPAEQACSSPRPATDRIAYPHDRSNHRNRSPWHTAPAPNRLPRAQRNGRIAYQQNNPHRTRVFHYVNVSTATTGHQ